MSFYKTNGSAGYGKTTALVTEIESLYDSQLANSEQSFVLVTPTNKAASVLNARLVAIGIPPLASTIHSTLYVWRKTDSIKSVKRVPVIDPDTLKFKKNPDGSTYYETEYEYLWEKAINPAVAGKTIYVDESSMVASEVWRDLMHMPGQTVIKSYGDEKQLPPIEKLSDLDNDVKPFYRFWHNFNLNGHVDTLAVNHRQAGDLKTFVEAVESSVFDVRTHYEIPRLFVKGDNFSLPANDLTDQQIKDLLLEADIVITPYNKVRVIVNHICRKELARKQAVKLSDIPLTGDRIILTSSIKEEVGTGRNKYRRVVLAKNTTAVIDAVHDYLPAENIVIVDITDELGNKFKQLVFSLQSINQKGNTGKYPTFNYAYAVTVHSAQGAAWPKVLYLDSHWPGNDASKLRYVAVTRASQTLQILTGVSNKTEAADAKTNALVRIGQ